MGRGRQQGEKTLGKENHVLTRWVLRHLEARRGLPCLALQSCPPPNVTLKCSLSTPSPALQAPPFGPQVGGGGVRVGSR